MTDETLQQAFRSTHYRIELPEGRFTLRVDEHSPALAAWQRAQQADCSALLTAFNPGGEARDEVLNAAAQRQLVAWLQRHRHALAHGCNEDPSGKWPPEPSVLAAGVSKEGALAIARRFGQLACLWSAADATPQLLWTPPR